MSGSQDKHVAELERLAGRYRRNKAPADFSARVMAAVGRTGQARAHRAPVWALAAGLVLSVVLALVYVREARQGGDVWVGHGALQTGELVAAAEWLEQGEGANPTDPTDLPDALSIQSLADMPDPFS